MRRSEKSRAEFTEYQAMLRRRIRSLPTGDAPAPWVKAAVVPVGGLWSVSVAADADGNDLVLVISVSGRSLVTPDGTRVARDRSEDYDDWLDITRLTAHGIGPLAGQTLATSGIHGGGLPRTTLDGWTLEWVSLDWPHELVILLPPRAPGLGEPFAGGVVLDPSRVTEIRAAGFSPSGDLLLIATSSDLTMWRR